MSLENGDVVLLKNGQRYRILWCVKRDASGTPTRYSARLLGCKRKVRTTIDTDRIMLVEPKEKENAPSL